MYLLCTALVHAGSRSPRLNAPRLAFPPLSMQATLMDDVDDLFGNDNNDDGPMDDMDDGPMDDGPMDKDD